MNIDPVSSSGKTPEDTVLRSPTNPTRTRIAQRLLEAASYPIVIVMAPAGFGKTTAIRHFLAQRDDVVFVNTPPATTLEQFIHAFARSCSQLLPEMTPPHESTSSTKDADSSLELYLSWATRHLRDANCTIAIDDLHHADRDGAVSTFLVRLADISKRRVQWLFSSRSYSNLPINRWQAYGDADAVITADDLRITVADAVEIASSLNSPARRDELQAFVEQTQGFPVPLAYAIRLSARRSSTTGIMDGTRSFTFGFLAEQLWSSLPPEERSLLEMAALLPAIHIHAFERSGYQNSSKTISRLCDGIAFLSLAPTGVFSMHDLFRDFVKRQITLEGPERQRSSYEKAVAVLLHSHYYNEAFELLIEAGDVGELLRVVERFASKITDLSVTHRIVSLTEDVENSELGLGALYLQTEYLSWLGEARKARLLAEETIRRPEATSRHLLCALQSIYRALDVSSSEDQRDFLVRLPQMISRLNEPDRIQAYACQASLLARLPDAHDEARSLVRQVHKSMNVLDSTSQVNALVALSIAYFYLGEHDASLLASREATEVARGTKNPRDLARVLNNLGLTLISVYDPEVELLFDELRELVEKTGSWRFAQTSHRLQAVYYAWKGDASRAMAACALQLAIIPASAAEKSFLNGVRRHTQNLCNLLRGDYEAITSDFARLGQPNEDDVAYDILIEVALAYGLAGNAGDSRITLARARRLHDAFPENTANLLQNALLLEVISMCAIGLWRQAKRLHDKHRGSTLKLKPIEDAISLLCQGPPFVAARQAYKNCLRQPYMGLMALLIERVIESSQYDMKFQLSAAEADVLRLLALGRTNKDIADTRERSAQTVKRQISALYKKLGVDNRTGAVAIARERGLL